ncbi:MAG: sulfotransferase family protein [Noviherbaspirillum sp.]
MDTTPSSRHHPFPVKLFNWVARSLNAVGLAKIDLSETALLAAARRATGLNRFGDESFLSPLRTLLKSLEQAQPPLNPFGRFHAKSGIVASLKNRLLAQACFEKHPEIRQRKIVAPIIIVGPARSGTTRLQRMLAADSRLQHLKAWEGFNPGPHIAKPDLGRAERHEEVKRFLGVGKRINPGAFRVHPMESEEADEEILLLNHSFCGLSPACLYNIPGYTDWLLAHDKTDAYRYMADLMKLISWSRGDAEDTRWVMKTPQHMMDLDVLMKVFPDARLVFIHRDPIKTVLSTMSLVWNFSVLNTDFPCRGPIGERWLDVCEEMARRCMKAREAIPAAQQIDVYYEQMNSNWRAVIQQIYGFIGMPLTPGAEHAMANWLAKSESDNHHSGHRYSHDEFGISIDEIDKRMRFFRDRYAIPYEGG